MKIQTKTCIKCKVEKPVGEFPKNVRIPGGYHYYCKTCMNAYIKAYQQTGKGEESVRRAAEKQRTTGYFRFGKGAIHILKQGAIKRGIPFLISADELGTWWKSVPDTCAYCGISIDQYRHLRDRILKYTGTNYDILKFRRLFRSPKHAAINWMTIDRKDNSRGYELTNMLKACWICNGIKGSLLTWEDVTLIAYGIIQKLTRDLEKEKDA